MAINIVFDFGAVLFSWRPDLLVSELFPRQSATDAAARELARDIFHHDDWQSFDRGTMELACVIERTAHRLDLPMADMSALMSGIGERLAPMPDTVALLAQLRERRKHRGDIRLYYLSNMPAPYARALERRHEFLNWFDGGVFSGDVQLVKPEPDIYALLESRYALVPDHTVFIDDLPANVMAARDRGWRAIHFESAAQLAPQLQFPDDRPRWRVGE